MPSADDAASTMVLGAGEIAVGVAEEVEGAEEAEAEGNRSCSCQGDQIHGGLQPWWKKEGMVRL